MPLNLEQRRGEPNVWDPATERGEWDLERWLLGAASGACIATGLRHRSLAGLLLIAGGGLLAWWVTRGVDDRRQQRARLTAAWPLRERHPDTVVEASEESFPASDAPSWTPTTGNRSNGRTTESRWH